MVVVFSLWLSMDAPPQRDLGIGSLQSYFSDEDKDLDKNFNKEFVEFKVSTYLCITQLFLFPSIDYSYMYLYYTGTLDHLVLYISARFVMVISLHPSSCLYVCVMYMHDRGIDAQASFSVGLGCNVFRFCPVRRHITSKRWDLCV